MYLESLCSLTLLQLWKKMSYRIWFSRVQCTDFSCLFPILKVPVDFPLRVQLWFYSGRFGSYFRLLCINSRARTCSEKKKKTLQNPLFILVMILVLTKLMNVTVELLISYEFMIFLCTLAGDGDLSLLTESVCSRFYKGKLVFQAVGFWYVK